jgi:hypothetical protein
MLIRLISSHEPDYVNHYLLISQALSNGKPIFILERNIQIKIQILGVSN